MDILIEFAWWVVRGAGFALGWVLTNALIDLVKRK